MIIYTSFYGKRYTEQDIKEDIKCFINNKIIFDTLNMTEFKALEELLYKLIINTFDEQDETLSIFLNTLTDDDCKYLHNKIIKRRKLCS